MPERCVGCDAEARQHPIIGIAWVRKELVEGQQSGYVAFPVCEKCWRDPEHRTCGYPLKMHFFPRAQAARALEMAGSTDLGK